MSKNELKEPNSMQFQKNSLAASGSPAAGSGCRSPARTSRCRSPAATRRAALRPGRAPRARPTAGRRAASRRRAGAAASGAARRERGDGGGLEEGAQGREGVPGVAVVASVRERVAGAVHGGRERGKRKGREREEAGEKNEMPPSTTTKFFFHSLSLFTLLDSLLSLSLPSSFFLSDSLYVLSNSRSFSLTRGRAQSFRFD